MRNLAIGIALLTLPRAIAAQDLGALSATTRSFVVDSAPLIAFRHARVIDGTGAPIREAQTILVKDGKIIAAGDDALVTIPTGAKEHDLTGTTIIPGLFDLHAHMYFFSNAGLTEMAVSGPRLYLAAGVTTARTAGGQLPYADLIMKRDIDRGRAPGPRLLITGPYLNGSGEGPGLNRRLDTPEEARRVVAYWAEEGATWLKFSGSVSRAVLGAAI